MAVIHWRPREFYKEQFLDLERIQDEMNRLFNFSLLRKGERESGLLESDWSPAVDILDSKDSLMVRADVPGMDKNDIDVTLHGDTLVIKGQKKKENNTSENGLVRTERYCGSFYRAMRLPSEVQADKVEANYTNGVLELVLPKSEKAKPKQVKVDIK